MDNVFFCRVDQVSRIERERPYEEHKPVKEDLECTTDSKLIIKIIILEKYSCNSKTIIIIVCLLLIFDP